MAQGIAILASLRLFATLKEEVPRYLFEQTRIVYKQVFGGCMISAIL
jgi:hypothetical protein